MASQQEVSRPLAEFTPTIYKNPLASLSVDDDSEYESCEKQVNLHKEKVREMLMSSTSSPVENIKLIDLLCRLGVSYHFEAQIEEQLKNIFDSHLNVIIKNSGNSDLYTTSLVFHTLRQHGYKVSCDVFNKFKNQDGKFKESLIADAKGMLSLYEAAQWSVHGEEILDEAVGFTKAHLETLANQSSPHLAKRIINALIHPYHKGMPAKEARQFIAFYEEDESRHEVLLHFAKLNFKLLQLLYRRELNHLFRWYEDTKITTELTYARDRIVELYLAALGTYFEPHYSQARIELTKFITIEMIFDDTYDAYGTIDELNRFTDVMDRFHLKSVSDDVLPDYLKFLHRLSLNFFEGIEKQLEKEKRSDCLFYAMNSLTQFANGLHEEATWLSQGHAPTFDEYTRNGQNSSGAYGMVVLAIVGLGDVAKLQEFEWLKNKPKILTAAMKILRYLNDLASTEFDHERTHISSSIELYKKQYGVSRKEAVEEIEKRVRDAWKDTNEDIMRPTKVPMQLLKTIVNISRVYEMIYYKGGDGLTHPEYLKDYFVSLLKETVSV